jgi:hypothetical protein
MRKHFQIFLYFLFLFVNFYVYAADKADEYELKAAFLEKFARFIEWPAEDWSVDKDKYFEIVVLGENPFGKKLDKLYSKLKIEDKSVKIRYISSINEIGTCQILFISPSMSSKITQILDKVSKKSILTIGQTSGFCEKGVHINFYIQSSKIKFQINEKAARNSNLKISHLLLQNATIINTIGGNNE